MALKGLADNKQKYASEEHSDIYTGMRGTSFSSPFAGGRFLAATERYPSLSPYDLITAAYVSCQATGIEAVGKIGDLSFINQAKDTKVPLWPGYNPTFAGFGIISDELFFNTLKEMDDLRIQRGLHTERKILDDTLFQRDKSKDEGGLISYKINFPADAANDLAMHVMLALHFDPNRAQPHQIMLMSPEGYQLPLSLSSLRDGNSFVNAPGFFARTIGGDWVLQFENGYHLQNGHMRIAELQENSLAATIVERHMKAGLEANRKRKEADQKPKDSKPEALPEQPSEPIKKPDGDKTSFNSAYRLFALRAA